ncbi:hypothetical protein OKA05_18385 [Luteolibacter arcticus]|uniref:Uncharacterized protein n=1 Tax=Luteolibacter arcticus TaxID=1581411 RepID=A0ABT3GLZ3_9BACT|nr:hypothetical protein [Luteolibacter arcticus]MCW1924540.1 hypothetical protein [Luteolibacter arcticus]
MILKYLAIFSFCAALHAGAAGRETLPWQALDDTELQRFAKQLGDRFDPEEVFGTPAMSRVDGVRVRIYPKGTRDLLIVETSPGNKESPELERFHAVRLQRAFEVKMIGMDAGTIRTVWEICIRAKPAAAKSLLQRLLK